MRFYRIYDITNNRFMSSRNSEVWDDLKKAQSYVKRLKNPDGYHKHSHDVINNEYYIFEYEMPKAGYFVIDNKLIDAPVEIVKTLYAKEL